MEFNDEPASETGVRMLNSINKHSLDITRVAVSGGEPLSPFIEAYDIDLFLSKDKILKAFGAYIFFDDQETQLNATSKVVPSGKVPYSTNSKMNTIKKK